MVVNMGALDSESIKLKVDKNRISGDYMTLFIRKTGDDRFEPFVPPTESASGFEKFIVQDYILSLASEKTDWTTLEMQVKGQLQGYSETTIKRAISNLTQSGKLLKIKRGEYEIAGENGRVKAALGLVN